MPGIYSLLAEFVRQNRPVAVATVVSGEKIGAKLLVPGDGETVGGIDPEIDASVAEDARGLLPDGQNRTLTYEIGGESIQVFIETFPPPQRLIIIGAVHVAIPLHRLARMLGYYVTVIDARGVLATPERFPQADQLLVEWPDEAMSSLNLDGSTSVVVLTHDPKFDHPALAAALKSPARYIGAIGSRTTNESRMEALREMGFTEEELSRIHAPVGLDIGAQTPAEIALAILGEIVATRYGRGGGKMSARSRQLETTK
jgi:xanthine dehydrogenase accessory factor